MSDEQKYFVALRVEQTKGTAQWIRSRKKMTEREVDDLFMKGRYNFDLIDDFGYATAGNFIWTAKLFPTLGGINEFFNRLTLEPKHGHWIAHDMSIKDVPTEACSECGGWSYGYNSSYCPHCGAKMKGEKNGSSEE